MCVVRSEAVRGRHKDDDRIQTELLLVRHLDSRHPNRTLCQYDRA